MKYTASSVKESVDANREHLMGAWALGRPENWSCNQQMKDLICIGNWLDEEMRRLWLDDLGRIMQTQQFNRRSRSEHDLWELAAFIMNEVIDNKIDRQRKPLRRWGLNDVKICVAAGEMFAMWPQSLS